MLGQALLPVFRERYEVYASDVDECDVRDQKLVKEEICGCNPRFVLHLAAMTDVDECERNPDEAFRINTLGTRNVALACQSCDAVMVYINTGSVYSGSKPAPYTEYDTPDPRSAYARSKYQGELIVRDLLSRFYVFYACWLFGGGADDKKFVANIFDLAGKNRELKIVDDMFGSPTYTADLSKAVYSFIESGLYGKYHCVNRGMANRFAVAEEILRIANITGCRLIPVSSAEFPRPAPRPRMEAMRNYNFDLLGLDLMRDWREALEEYILTTLT
jgi:dTDP-4-dehydrorhamnose reductase